MNQERKEGRNKGNKKREKPDDSLIKSNFYKKENEDSFEVDKEGEKRISVTERPS